MKKQKPERVYIAKKYFCPATKKCGWSGAKHETVDRKGDDFMGDFIAPACPKCNRFVYYL